MFHRVNSSAHIPLYLLLEFLTHLLLNMSSKIEFFSSSLRSACLQRLAYQWLFYVRKRHWAWPSCFVLVPIFYGFLLEFLIYLFLFLRIMILFLILQCAFTRYMASFMLVFLLHSILP